MKQIVNYSKNLLFVFVIFMCTAIKLNAQENVTKSADFYNNMQNNHLTVSSQSGIRIDKNSVCIASCNSGYVVNSTIQNNSYLTLESGLEVLFTEINTLKSMRNFVPNGFYKIKLYKKEKAWYADFIDMKGKNIKTLQSTEEFQELNPKAQKIKPSVGFSDGKLRIDFGQVTFIIGIEIAE